jgi:hypothetical protein
MLVFNVIVINYSFEYQASSPEIDSNDNSSILSDHKSRSYNPVWDDIQVISEPIPGQNFNSNISYNCDIAVDGDKIYVIWVDNSSFKGSGTDWDIFYRFFDGYIWSDIQVISEPVEGKNFNTGSGVRCSIAVENGKIYVCWDDFNITSNSGSDYDIHYRCNLTGKGWEPIQVISEPVLGSNTNTEASMDPIIEVENGNIHVIWVDLEDYDGAYWDADIFYRGNLGGSGWGIIEVVSEPAEGLDLNTGNSEWPALAVENRNVYCVWRDKSNLSNCGEDGDIFFRYNNGSNWSDIQAISEPILGENNDKVGCYHPEIAVENGKIYSVWGGLSNYSGEGTDRDVYLRCNLSGTSWETIQVISEPVEGKNLNTGSTGAVCSIDVENGGIYICWADSNNTNGAGTDGDVMFRSNTTGNSWSPIQVISEPIFGMDINNGSTPGTVMCTPIIKFEDDNIHIIWNDNNDTLNSGRDIDINYRSSILSSLALSYPGVEPSFGTTSTDFNFTVYYRHVNNTPPEGIKFYLDDTEYSLTETNPQDHNYLINKKYYCTITNLDIGNHEFYFWASDGFNTTTTRVIKEPLVINTKPVITTPDNITAIEDIYFETIYEFIDKDRDNFGQDCTWEFESNASWLEFLTIQSNNSGKLFGTPSNEDVGMYYVNININDSLDFDQRNFNITVLDVNDKPEIISKDILTAKEDELYQVFYKAIDIDSPINKQVWSIETNARKWLRINSTSGELNGTPSNDDVGIHWMNVTVDDTEGGYDFSNFTLEVMNVNDPPVIITENKLLATTGQLYEVDYEATDIDNNLSKLTWSLETNATWLFINRTSGILSGIPPHSGVGWYHVNVSVSDVDNGIDWQYFTLNTIKGNEPPVIITTDLEVITVNQLYYVDYDCIDDRTDQSLVIWLLESNATWLSIDKNSGILTGTPTSSDVGSYWINISVFDSNGGVDFHYFTLTVLPEPPPKNYKPRLTNPDLSPHKGDTGTEFIFTVYYLDSDSDPPIFIKVVIDGIEHDMDPVPGGKSYNGQYKYATKLKEGEHKYYFTASDGVTNVTTAEFTTTSIKKGESSSIEMGFLALIVVIIIVVVLIIMFSVLLRKRKKDLKEPEKVSIPNDQSTQMVQPIYDQSLYPIQNIPNGTLPSSGYPSQPQPELQYSQTQSDYTYVAAPEITQEPLPVDPGITSTSPVSEPERQVPEAPLENERNVEPTIQESADGTSPGVYGQPTQPELIEQPQTYPQDNLYTESTPTDITTYETTPEFTTPEQQEIIEQS